MQVADLNLIKAVIDLEVNLGVVQKHLDYLISNNSNLKGPSGAQIQRFREEVQKDIQNKYPALGVRF